MNVVMSTALCSVKVDSTLDVFIEFVASPLTMFRRIHIRTGSAIFYPRNTPSMIVNNIP